MKELTGHEAVEQIRKNMNNHGGFSETEIEEAQGRYLELLKNSDAKIAVM